jgi:hypothetical protein
MLVACTMTAGLLGAQSPGRRITAEITRSAMSPLQGSQHPLALAQNDAGRMPGDTRLTGISLYFNRSRRNRSISRPARSPAGSGLAPVPPVATPDQFAARLGMAQL